MQSAIQLTHGRPVVLRSPVHTALQWKLKIDPCPREIGEFDVLHNFAHHMSKFTLEQRATYWFEGVMHFTEQSGNRES